MNSFYSYTRMKHRNEFFSFLHQNEKQKCLVFLLTSNTTTYYQQVMYRVTFQTSHCCPVQMSIHCCQTQTTGCQPECGWKVLMPAGQRISAQLVTTSWAVVCDNFLNHSTDKSVMFYFQCYTIVASSKFRFFQADEAVKTNL